MHALCFMVFKLGLDSFKLILRGPIVCSWLSAGIWERRPPKEATPFPLFVVFELEVAAVQQDNEDRFCCEPFCSCFGPVCGFLMLKES